MLHSSYDPLEMSKHFWFLLAKFWKFNFAELGDRGVKSVLSQSGVLAHTYNSSLGWELEVQGQLGHKKLLNQTRKSFDSMVENTSPF